MQLTTRRFLHDIVAENLNLPKNKVVWANQDGVKQANPLVTLRTYSHQGESMEDHIVTDDGVMTIKTPTAFVLEIRYFGKKSDYPVDYLDDLVRVFEKPTVVDVCWQNGVAFLYADPVQDITTILENTQQYEPAAAVDFHCRYTNSITDDVGQIDTVNITGEFDPQPEPGPGPTPTPQTVTGSQLIYGNIAADGTVTDLVNAIPVNLSASTDDND